jgi:hypothetical protein
MFLFPVDRWRVVKSHFTCDNKNVVFYILPAKPGGSPAPFAYDPEHPDDCTGRIGRKKICCGQDKTIARRQEKSSKKKPDKIRTYSMWIASAGQASTQVWQSTHISLSIFALSFSIDIADAGHSLTQVSHPVHLSLSTTATNSFTPVIMFILLVKKGLLSDRDHTRKIS